MAYIDFKETKDRGKTKIFSVNSKSESKTLFDSKCMNEIIDFINNLMDDRRK